MVPCLSDSLSWDANVQGQFITSLCRDTRGSIWVGTEDQGVYRIDPDAPKVVQYTHFTTKEGLGDDNAYALACDKAGRVWVGTLNHGVSVYNGKSWRTYGPLDGPLGSRIFALAVSPKDGGVWGATEAGLFRYQNSHWSYFTRAEGLPSDQANALAFDTDGTLYVGTQCDGIAIASPADNYKSWRVVPGPRQMPSAATGNGLPSALINCLLVSANGTVYAGTPLGLAESRDEGLTWHFRRGVDWKAKLAGLYHPIVPDERPISGDLLHDDYVTCLGEDGAGRLFIGHRQGGVEVFDPKLGKRVQSGANGGRLEDYIGALLVEDKAVWVGMYGGGLLPPAHPEARTASSIAAPPIPALPVPSAPPTLAQLNTMLARVKSLTGQMPVGSGAYLGEDWCTKGDWVGRYGRQYAELCAIQSPFDHFPVSTLGYSAQCFEGPHRDAHDNFRRWVHWITTENRNSVYDPIIGHRRQAEFDDHGEAYDRNHEGPGLYFKVIVPAGLHRVSLYFFNKDGESGDNRYRDYLIQLKPFVSSLDQAEKEPPLAQTRVHNFRGGVYPQFLLAGPSTYYLRLAKNDSLNVICSAVFIDHIAEDIEAREDMNTLWMGGKRYDPPTSDKNTPPSDLTTAARKLWGDPLKPNPYRIDAKNLTADRVLAYRAALAGHAPSPLLENWRWNLHLWGTEDRKHFDTVMADAFQTLLEKYPDLKRIKD